MMSGASMYAALIRPVINDSLSSGQPLYLLNSNSGLAFATPASAAVPAQATGSVRLHVTGRPPTCNGFTVCAWSRVPSEAIAAAAPNTSRRRRTERSRGFVPSIISSFSVIAIIVNGCPASTRNDRLCTAGAARIVPHLDQQCGGSDEKQCVVGRIDVLIETQHGFNERDRDDDHALPVFRSHGGLRVRDHEKDEELIHRSRDRRNLRLPRASGDEAPHESQNDEARDI